MSEEESTEKKGFRNRIRRIKKQLKRYAEITEVAEIARRYFVMNAFDGALTTLGILIGFFLAGVTDSQIVVVTVLAGALAMGISGLWGAFLAESAERKRELKQLEHAMMADLSKSVMARASKFATIFSALIDGLSPALAAVVGLIPFFFGEGNPGLFNTLFYISIGLNLGVLFLLGMFLGRVSKENVILMGLKVLTAGIVITVLLFVLNLGH